MGNACWFHTSDFGHRVRRIDEAGLGSRHAAHMWLVTGRDRALLIDAGVGVLPLKPTVEASTDLPVICLLTHSHYDHIGGGWEFADRWAHTAEAPILAAPTPEATQWQGWLTDEAFLVRPYPGFRMTDYALKPATPSRHVVHGDEIDLGGRILTVLHVRGHSPGLLAVYERKTGLLFTSDALYDGPMYFDLPGSNGEAARASMEFLATLPVQTVHPGHGESFSGARLRQIAEEQSRRLVRS